MSDTNETTTTFPLLENLPGEQISSNIAERLRWATEGPRRHC